MPRDDVAAPEAPPPSSAARRFAGAPLSRWAVPVALSLLVLVSLWLRTRALGLHYWIDEGLSVGIAGHPVGQILSILRQDGSPPLYYLLLHFWMAWRGTGEAATHELSLVFALLIIPAAYWAGAGLFSRRAGLVSAVLAAGAPYLTTYGQETRMYSLLALLALVVAASFVHAFVRRDRRYLPVFVVSLTASLYTHNWALFLGLMTAVAFLVCVRELPQERPALWRDGAIAFGSVAVLFAPWVPSVLYQAAHTGAPWALPPVIWSLTQAGYSLVGGRGAAVALALGAGVGLLALRGAPDVRTRRLLLGAGCLLILGVGTLLTAWAYAKITPAWAIRYFAVIAGPLIVLFGLGIARAGRLGLVVLALTASFWVLDPVASNLSSKSNVASAVAKVRPDLRPGTLVLSTQPEQVPTLAYYLPRGSHFGSTLGPVLDPRFVDWRDALRRLRRTSVQTVLMPMIGSLAPGQRLLLVVPTNLPSSPLWMKIINRAGRQWAKALGNDHSLRRLATTSVHSASAGLAVRITVYVRS
ncbi:MAG: glycosyltransferase family 39 protein [Solirubrobacteraceae bacterium]